jgi:hypothetical protein
MSRDILWF